MKTENTGKRISDNPTVSEMTATLSGIRVLAKTERVLRRIRNGGEQPILATGPLDELMESASLFQLPDRFNAAFAGKGWTAVGHALSVDVTKSALNLHELGNSDEAEEILVEWFTEDNIRLCARRFHRARLRDHQLQEALHLILEEGYMAAVPLILIACDGFASDVAAVSPFEKDADLSCFDSISGHGTALPALMKLLTTGVRKSRDDVIDLPLRHGVLHGRSLGHAIKRVCAKAWPLMMALVDWAHDKSSEADRQLEHEERKNRTVKDDQKMFRMLKEDKKAINAFEPYEIVGPPRESFASHGPKAAIVDFLSGWKPRNYGKMVKVAMNHANSPGNKMAEEFRRMAEFVDSLNCEIKSIRHSTVARCDDRIPARAKTIAKEVNCEFGLFLLRCTSGGYVAMPNDEGCKWVVQQNCIYDVMNGIYAKDTRSHSACACRSGASPPPNCRLRRRKPTKPKLPCAAEIASDIVGIIGDSLWGGGQIRCVHRNQETPEVPRAYST